MPFLVLETSYFIESCVICALQGVRRSATTFESLTDYMNKSSSRYNAIFCWETLGAGIHQDVMLKHTTHLNQVHPFTPVVSPDSRGLFQQAYYALATLQKLLRNGFEEHDKEFKFLTRPPNSPHFNPIEHLCLRKCNLRKPHLATFKRDASYFENHAHQSENNLCHNMHSDANNIPVKTNKVQNVLQQLCTRFSCVL